MTARKSNPATSPQAVPAELPGQTEFAGLTEELAGLAEEPAVRSDAGVVGQQP